MFLKFHTINKPHNINLYYLVHILDPFELSKKLANILQKIVSSINWHIKFLKWLKIEIVNYTTISLLLKNQKPYMWTRGLVGTLIFKIIMKILLIINMIVNYLHAHDVGLKIISKTINLLTFTYIIATWSLVFIICSFDYIYWILSTLEFWHFIYWHIVKKIKCETRKHIITKKIVIKWFPPDLIIFLHKPIPIIT